MALTTCQTCGTTRNETVAEHLMQHHVNEAFSITYDPQTEVGIIGERVGEWGGAEVGMMDSPPVDHGSDRWGYIEIQGAPDENARPSWLTPDWQPCPDCNANAFLTWVPHEQRWLVTVAHDDGCPELARHEGG